MYRSEVTVPITTVLTVLMVLVAPGIAIQPAVADAATTPAASPLAADVTGPDASPVAEVGRDVRIGVQVVADDVRIDRQDDGVVPIDVQDEEVTLEENVRRQARGDVVVLTFEFSGGAEEARVTLGSSEDVSFEVEFTVRDGDGDGTVVVLWNTAESHAPGAGLSVQSDGQGPDEDGFSEGPNVVDDVTYPVEPAEYPVSVVTAATGVETDLGTVFVEERSSENLTVHTAPASAESFESAADVERAASSAAAGETIAVGDRAQDWVVLRLNASGLTNDLGEAADLDDDSDGVTLTVEQDRETRRMNDGPTNMSLGGNATLYVGGDDSYYLVFEPSALLDAGADIGDRFTANFSVNETHELTETNETLSATFTLVEGTASFDLEDGTIAAAGENATVTGTSTWAPGTELIVHLRSSDASGNGTPFTERMDTVEVADDGTWNATVDLTEQAPGQEVTAMLFHAHSKAKLESVEGELR